MRMKIWITALALTAGVGAAGAQQIVQSGRVINAPWFDAGHRLILSQNDYIYGTARSAAMSGAFVSLGADLSSMNINPAGLGMYQSSDWGFTQALSIDKMSTASPHMAPATTGSNRVSYGLNNIGAVYNVFNSSGVLTSLSLGFSYNRAANFNSRTRIETFGENSSIASMFAKQLDIMAGEGITRADLASSANPWSNPNIMLQEWGAVLGYQTGLVGINDEGGYGYFNDAIPSNSYFGSAVRGGIYEYSFSLGANITNKLYVGMTLGATEIRYDEDTSYEEVYTTSGAMFGDMWFDQTTGISGGGLTAKFGVIARPIEALRIGVAFHLPTYYTVDKTYTAAMGVWDNDARREVRFDTGAPLFDRLQFRTAPRLLAGVSGVIADRAIVALDWDVAWYNKIAMRNASTTEISDSKAEAQSLYRPAHSVRAGLEYRLTDIVSLRAGGSWMPDFMRNKSFVANNPTARSGYGITGGVGFNIGRNGYLDLAYVYNRARMTDYEFYFLDSDGAGGLFTGQYDSIAGADIPRVYTPTRNHHMITLTLGNRF